MPRKQSSGKYKLKTHKATSKRFRTTGTGKIVRTKIGKGHLRRNTIQADQVFALRNDRRQFQRAGEAHQASGALYEQEGLRTVLSYPV